MLTELEKKAKVVGTKETLQAIDSGNAVHVFIAEDSDNKIKNKIINAAKSSNIDLRIVDSKMKLGRACGIDVAAASAALLK